MSSIPGAPQDLSSAASPPSRPSTSGSTSASAGPPSSSSSSGLLHKVKRRLSSRASSLKLKEHLPPLPLPGRAKRRTSSPGGLGDEGREEAQGTTETRGEGTLDHPRAYTIAPPDHRENTTLHAILDSLPSLSFGSLHSPSVFMNLPLPSFPSRPANVASCLVGGAEGYEDSDDETPSGTPASGAGPGSPPLPHSQRGTALPRSPPLFSRRSSDPKQSNDPFDRLYGNVVMLGGFRGSVLRSASSGKRLWIPLKVGFGMRKADLGLGLEDEDEMKSEETVVPGNMLCQVAGVVDLGKRLKDKLKQTSSSQRSHQSQSTSSSFPFSTFSPSSTPTTDESKLRPPVMFHSFGYDWRRSLELSSAKLRVFLEKLKRDSAARGEGENGEGVGATVIAHSMGGLVLLHALATAEDPSIIRGIVFAGTPFQGCVNVLGALKLGGDVYRNPRVGSSSTVFSWRSSYYFLPRPPVADPNEEASKHDILVEEPEELDTAGAGVVPGGERESVPATNDLPPPVGAAIPSSPPLSPSPSPSPAAANGASTTPSTPATAVFSPSSRTSRTSSPSSRTSSRRSSSTASNSASALSSAACSCTPSSPAPCPACRPRPSTHPLPSSTSLNPSTALPPLSSFLSGCFETPAGTPIPVDFFDPASFSRYALSPVTVGMDLGRTSGEGGGCCSEAAQRRVREGGERDSTTLPQAGAVGNLGERSLFPSASPSSSSSPVEAAASGVKALEEQLASLGGKAGLGTGEGKTAEGEIKLREEEERLRKQTKEEETVRAYLERCLSRAQKFHEDLLTLYSPSKRHLYPPIAVLSSRSTATVRGVLSTSRETIAEEGYDRLLWAEGDGIVLWESATRLPGDPEVRGGKRGEKEGGDGWMDHLKGCVESQHGHVSLLGDLDGVRKCLELLYG
ncbi:hypothetical protein JCM10213_003131 [Rhodosporidiobolus nylandii]